MPIDQQRVSDVARDHRQIIILEIIQVVYDVNASASAEVRWFDNPEIFLRLFLGEKIEVRIELSQLVRKNVGVWDYIVDAGSPELFLHFHDIKAQSVFPCNFIT